MVLPLKRWKSRTSPGIVAGVRSKEPIHKVRGRQRCRPFAVSTVRRTVELVDAGWSSPVARQAHNLKVVGSNPTPATNKKPASLWDRGLRSEEHTSELQSLMRISYAVLC